MAEYEGKEPDAEAAVPTSSGGPNSGLETVALALAAKQRGGKPDAKLDAFLEKQGRLTDSQDKLVNLQMEHLREEQELQRRHGRLKYFGERLKVGLQLLTIAAGLAIATGVATLVWSAASADNLVIEAFSVPPAMAARGITGEALARQLNDDLAAISEVAQSPEQQRGLSGDWGASLSVEIPSTGISLSQLDQWLREKLGHQSRVSGEVTVSPEGGLTLAARSGSHGLPPLKGVESDMAALIQRTAEAVYAREQPRSYGLYLVRQRRSEEARAWYLGRTTQPAARDRALSYYGLAWGAQGAEGDLAFLPLVRKSIAADPTLSPAVRDLADFEGILGHLESSYQLLRRAGDLAARDTTYVAEWRREQTRVYRSQVAALMGDWREVRVQARAHFGRHLLGNGDTGNAGPSAAMARASAAMHDIRQAQADLAAYDAATPDDLEKYRRASVLVRLGAEDWTGAITAADELLADDGRLPDKGRERVEGPTLKARALAHLGRIAEAQSLIASTKLDCQPCVSARGEIAALAGDARGADHWFSEAVRMALSLPMANTDWGRVLLDRGEPDKAIARFEAANRQGAHFADPLSYWGEALLTQGKAGAAVAKFAEADKYAPRWGRNHILWGEALAKQGKNAEARAQYTAAAGMDLTGAERAGLNQLLARPA